MNGSAPKTPCAGFHSVPKRNPAPNSVIVGHALRSIMTKIAATISKMLVAAAVKSVLNTLSPNAPVFAKSDLLLLLTQRLAAARHRIQLRFDLFQNLVRQRNVMQLRRVRASVVKRPP